MNASPVKKSPKGRVFCGVSVSLHPSQVARLKEIERDTGVKLSTSVQRALASYLKRTAPGS